jgi:hypothetical protein
MASWVIANSWNKHLRRICARDFWGSAYRNAMQDGSWFSAADILRPDRVCAWGIAEFANVAKFTINLISAGEPLDTRPEATEAKLSFGTH